MAIVQVSLDPSPRDLKWFGLIALLFFLLVGGVVWWRTHSIVAAVILWSIGALLAVTYYLVRPLRRPFYVGWMRAVYPLALVVSHLVLGLTFFLLITPTAAFLRVLRRDPLRRRLDRTAQTYWIRRAEGSEVTRYFRQS